MESRALGRGLSALIPEKFELKDSAPQPAPATIKIDKIKNNSQQPRSHYDDMKLDELKKSIQEKGFLQPILVRPFADGYEVIAGERRLRAARALNLTEVPAIVKDVSSQEAFIIALVENIQREDLNAIEEAQAFRRLIDDYKFTQDAVAKAVAKDISTVNNLLRLLNLPEYIQEAVVEERLTMGHARALLAVTDSYRQHQLFDQVITKGLSVRELEATIKAEGHTLLRKARREKPRSLELSSIEEELQRVVGSKVRIQSQKKRGKIIIEYYSLDDLERILGILKK